MARIRVLSTKSTKNMNKPKVMFFHKDNFDSYTTKRGGRYSANRSSYGASEETDKSFHYMLKALEDFIKVLHEEVNTPQQKQMLRETIQRSMM